MPITLLYSHRFRPSTHSTSPRRPTVPYWLLIFLIWGLGRLRIRLARSIPTSFPSHYYFYTSNRHSLCWIHCCSPSTGNRRYILVLRFCISNTFFHNGISCNYNPCSKLSTALHWIGHWPGVREYRHLYHANFCLCDVCRHCGTPHIRSPWCMWFLGKSIRNTSSDTWSFCNGISVSWISAFGAMMFPIIRLIGVGKCPNLWGTLRKNQCYSQNCPKLTPGSSHTLLLEIKYFLGSYYRYWRMFQGSRTFPIGNSWEIGRNLWFGILIL